MSKQDPSHVCNAIRTWAALMEQSKRDRGDVEDAREFSFSWLTIHLGITKSCLLDRVLHGGESPSKTPCPVHKGKWSGCHMQEQFTTPMSEFAAGIYGDPSWVGKTMRELGCRCNLHTCGCTTGWNPDEHCGCGVKP